MKNILRSLTILLIFAAAHTAVFAGIESIATVTSTDKGTNVTLPSPWSTTVFAGTFNAVIDGNPTKLYCVDINNPLAYNQSYQDVTATDIWLTYVLNNYYPFKAYPYTGSLSTVQKEASAVQLALWHFSDGLNVNSVSVSDAGIKTRALAIISDAQANAHSFSLNTFMIVIPPQSFTIGSPVNFTVQAFDDLGIAMPNVSITLSTTAGTLSQTTVTTGPTGVTPVITLNPGGNITEAEITATGTVGIPAGTKYYHVANPNGKQKLILATPTIASRTVKNTITWYNQINLVVDKTADKTVVNNGDFINYRIVVKNTGSGNAQNVEVSDQLPAVLDFISSTPSGVFNPLTGIWSVGNLNAGDSAVLIIQTKVDYSNVNATQFTLGPASPYNFFVIDTLIQPSADTEGKIAVGGYADLRNYSVGDKLPPNSGDVLVVGNHLTFISGRVYNGRAVYQNFITTTMGFSADSGIVQDSVVDFPAAKLYLENLSSQLSTLQPTDTMKFSYYHVELVGTNPGLNVFNIDGSILFGANNFTVDVPSGATVVVNISGDSSRLFGGFDVSGTTKDKVLLNFYEATKLHISGIDVRASVLAPFADLTFPAGVVTGQLIVRKMFGSGQINLSPFTGSISGDTTFTNFATVVGANQNNMPGFFNAVPGMSMVASSPSSVTSVKSGASVTPVEYKLDQNYPNPFNPSTVVRFSLPAEGYVKISVYNITGELVSTLSDGYMESGIHEVRFDASSLPSGIYICRMNAGEFSFTRKMILQK
ncbi:MAG: choice-of-anchor A family protein [Ignavibacteriaceae bacterium]|nr:choice-of-anchor A family protein [Ignavibacteriaceae bacterium]